MATTRYFKATDGSRTFFRASPSQTYASLTVDPAQSLDFGWTLHRDGRGKFPAVEIDDIEYKQLVRLKKQRAPKATAPRASWIFNKDIEARAEADAIVEKHNSEGGPALLRELFRFN